MSQNDMMGSSPGNHGHDGGAVTVTERSGLVAREYDSSGSNSPAYEHDAYLEEFAGDKLGHEFDTSLDPEVCEGGL